MIVPFDMHAHTYYSPCGRRLTADGRPSATPAMYAAEAPRLGLQVIYLTDHFVEDPTDPAAPQFYKGSGPAILADLRRELSALAEQDGVRFLVGCETETYSTERVGVSPALAAQLDIVLVPTTHYHLPGVPQPASDAPAAVARHMLTMLDSVVRKPWLDVVAHPFAEREALIGDLRAIYDAMDQSWLVDISGQAAEAAMAMEANAASLSDAGMPHYREVLAQFLPLARAAGCKLSLGSDAHQVDMLAWPLQVEGWLRGLGLSEADFITPDDLVARRHRV
jgi:histidinol phosphatase-like PHP family hydrolase